MQSEEHLIQQLTGRDIRVTVDVMGITAARGLRKRVEVITAARHYPRAGGARDRGNHRAHPVIQRDRQLRT